MRADYQWIIRRDFVNCRKRIKKNVKSGDLRKFSGNQKMPNKIQLDTYQTFTQITNCRKTFFNNKAKNVVL